MYTLIHGSHIESIADDFRKTLGSRLPDNALAQPEVIVPNRDTARWLSLFLAEKDGITGNIRYLLPSEWLWEQIRQSSPDLPSLLPSDPAPMTWGVLSLLEEEETLAACPELKSCLLRQTEPQHLAWKLARQISHVFDQYQVYRPDMLKNWERGEMPPSDKWQAVLWRRLIKRWNSMPDRRMAVSRSGLYHRLSSQVRQGTVHNSSPLYLFNPGLLPPPISRILQQLSQSCDLYHFLIASSTGLFTLGESSVLKNGLLAGFGSEQEKQARQLKRFIAEVPIAARVVESQGKRYGTHNLGRIQKSVVSNSPVPRLRTMDESMKVHSCHSPLREVETLHRFLTGLFSDRKDILPDDILVVMPDLSHYRPFIEAVFGTVEEGFPQIPYGLSGAGTGSAVARAFSNLLRMPGSRFKKEDVFQFLQHAPIRDCFHLSVADLSKLAEWFRENRVIWGLDGSHRKEFLQPPDDLHTWKSAMKRGWLGQMVTEQPGTIWQSDLLFTLVSTSEERELWARMQQVLRLLEQVDRSSRQVKTPAEWKVELVRWMDLFIPDSAPFRDEVQVLGNEIQDTIREMEIGGYRDRVPFTLVAGSLADRLEESSARSVSFTRGVTFHSMVPVRSLPFKVIALLGLNDDHFPRKPVHPSFDLMAGDPRPGERDRRDEDRNLFLESVMAASDVHYSSYIGRNQQDDERIPPSSILDEWIRIVSDALPEDFGKWVREERLHGFSTGSFLAGRENSFDGVYYKVAKKNAMKRAKLRGFDNSEPLPALMSGAIVELDTFEQFFRNPIRAFFRNRFGVTLRDRSEEVEEEFVMDGLDTHILFQHIFEWSLHGVEQEVMYELLIQSGHLPAGWPGRRRLQDLVRMAQEAVQQILERDHQPGRSIHPVSVSLTGMELIGDIRSWSRNSMLDLHPSSLSGRRVLPGWIRHLVLCHTRKDVSYTTNLFTGFKNGSGDWHSLKYEPDAEQLLEDMAVLFQKGMKQPVNLYIDSAFEYAVNLNRGEDQALKKALNTWGGGFNAYPENGDAYLELAYGRDAEADASGIKEIADRLYAPLVANMEGRE